MSSQDLPVGRVVASTFAHAPEVILVFEWSRSEPVHNDPTFGFVDAADYTVVPFTIPCPYCFHAIASHEPRLPPVRGFEAKLGNRLGHHMLACSQCALLIGHRHPQRQGSGAPHGVPGSDMELQFQISGRGFDANWLTNCAHEDGTVGGFPVRTTRMEPERDVDLDFYSVHRLVAAFGRQGGCHIQLQHLLLRAADLLPSQYPHAGDDVGALTAQLPKDRGLGEHVAALC
mmetsp:Transcript_79594/g.165328  ORF Transcript_79594/g.165328 Transcript_79594/m.165328 type:complete len:230 (+) Transcript_79594:127-816(+)